jgi:hypothetical protein
MKQMRIDMAEQLKQQRKLATQIALLVKQVKGTPKRAPESQNPNRTTNTTSTRGSAPPSPFIESKKGSFDSFEEAWRLSGDPYAAHLSNTQEDFSEDQVGMDQAPEKQSSEQQSGKLKRKPKGRNSLVAACQNEAMSLDDLADEIIEDGD